MQIQVFFCVPYLTKISTLEMSYDSAAIEYRFKQSNGNTSRPEVRAVVYKAIYLSFFLGNTVMLVQNQYELPDTSKLC